MQGPRQDPWEMDWETFGDLAGAYGADLRRWPADQRLAAEALMRRDRATGEAILARERRLDHLLPPGSAEGRRFLLGHGPRHGAMWREFCAALEQCGDSPERRADMIGAALAAFAVFGDWFGPAANAAAA